MYDTFQVDAWDTDIRPLEAILEEANNNIASARKRNADPRYQIQLAETAEFMLDVYEGKRPVRLLVEALSTSDFPILFGDVLQAQILGNYAETPMSWQMYIGRVTVNDFRTQRLVALDGMEQPFFPSWKKAELETVKEDNQLTETGYTFNLAVYEKGFSISWQTIINDSLDAFRSLPNRLARGARRTEQKFASSLYQDSSGPNSTFFSNGNTNLVNTTNGAASNNPVLSVQGVTDALNVMYRMKDSGGDPIFIDGGTLVVPPALAITAEQILGATSFSFNPGVTSGASLNTPNWIGPKLKLAVDWYAPVINTTNGHTAWYIFANPQARPAATLAFLRGYEQPAVYRKAPNTERLGGGMAPDLGDFEDMSQRYKGLHILGGTLVDPKAAVVSNGTGS